jgi:hypothetical protein
VSRRRCSKRRSPLHLLRPPRWPPAPAITCLTCRLVDPLRDLLIDDPGRNEAPNASPASGIPIRLTFSDWPDREQQKLTCIRTKRLGCCVSNSAIRIFGSPVRQRDRLAATRIRCSMVPRAHCSSVRWQRHPRPGIRKIERIPLASGPDTREATGWRTRSVMRLVTADTSERLGRCCSQRETYAPRFASPIYRRGPTKVYMAGSSPDRNQGSMGQSYP